MKVVKTFKGKVFPFATSVMIVMRLLAGGDKANSV